MMNARSSAGRIEDLNASGGDQLPLLNGRPRLPSLASVLTSGAEPRPDQRPLFGEHIKRITSKPSSFCPEIGRAKHVKDESQKAFVSSSRAHCPFPSTIDSSSFLPREKHDSAKYMDLEQPSRPIQFEKDAHQHPTLHSSTISSADVLSVHPAQQVSRDRPDKQTSFDLKASSLTERLSASRRAESKTHDGLPHHSNWRRPPTRAPSATVLPHWSGDFHNVRHSSMRDELFWGLMDIFSVAGRYNSVPSHVGRSSFENAEELPLVREGDVPRLRQYLEYELDVLHVIDSPMSERLRIKMQASLERFASRDGQARPSVDPHFHHMPSRTREFLPMHASEALDDSDDEQRRYNGQYFIPHRHNCNGMLPPLQWHDNRGGAYPMSGGSDFDTDSYGTSSLQKAYATPPWPLTHFRDRRKPSLQARCVAAAPVSKRLRKRRDEINQCCLSCSASETPEWRKGPTGPRTLCNACGLLFAKQCRKRNSILRKRWRKVEGVGLHEPEQMTDEEREGSLLELQSIVQNRLKQAQGLSGSAQAATPFSSFSSTPFRQPERTTVMQTQRPNYVDSN